MLYAIFSLVGGFQCGYRLQGRINLLKIDLVCSLGGFNAVIGYKEGLNCIAIVWASNYYMQGSRTPVYKISRDIQSEGGSGATLYENFP